MSEDVIGLLRDVVRELRLLRAAVTKRDPNVEDQPRTWVGSCPTVDELRADTERRAELLTEEERAQSAERLRAARVKLRATVPT